MGVLDMKKLAYSIVNYTTNQLEKHALIVT